MPPARAIRRRAEARLLQPAYFFAASAFGASAAGFFAVSAAFVFGDHLGFTAGFAPEMLGAMIAGKLVGGVSAIAVALWLTRKEEKA